MIEQHNNSVIYRDVDEDYIIDFSHLGTRDFETVELYELSNGFILGDAIYYDIYTKHYRRALANNSIMSEVIGVVSKIIDKDNFELTLKGNIILDRYNKFENDTILYLSPVISGKLVNEEPDDVSKIVAIKTPSGISVNIQRGYKYNSTAYNQLYDSDDKRVKTQPDDTLLIRDDFGTDLYDYENLRYYTNDEIQAIIQKVKTDIYD